MNHDEGNREERPGRFLITRAPIGQHVKMFRQLNTPPGHVKERVYPKQVNQEGDAQRDGELKAMKKDETIFAAYDKAEMRKAKIMIVANSRFVYTSKSLFWSREFPERTGDAAHRRNSEPAVRWASNTDCDYPRKLGRTNEIDVLSRADERESEEFRYEEIHGLVE